MSHAELLYNDFIYKLNIDTVREIMDRVFGTIWNRGLIGDGCTIQHFCIKRGSLYLTSMTDFTDAYGLSRLLDGDYGSFKYEEYDDFDSDEWETTTIKLYKVVFRNVEIPVDYSGILEAKQYYTDEQQEKNGKCILQNSFFKLDNGVLDEQNSEITHVEKTNIEEYTWKDGIEGVVIGESFSRRIYYIDPVGSLAQNQFLISATLEYLTHGELTDDILDKILSYSKPVLRVDYMEEIDWKRATFEKRSCDLVIFTIMKGDAPLFKKLYPYIQFERYQDYPQNIIAALEQAEMGEVEGCKDIRRFLGSVGFN